MAREVSRPKTAIGALFILAFMALALELFSFLATKAKLLSFNLTPPYSMTLNEGLDWRTDDQSWGAWHAEHARDRHVADCFDIEYQSNNVGARDTRDYDDSLAGDSIVLLGDSFAEGLGVNIEDTFAKRVEREANRAVLNFGTAGYVGPVQEDLIYAELANGFPHDELIYMFLPSNDFTDNAPQSMHDFGNRYRPYYQKTDDGYAVVYPENAIRGAPYPGSRLSKSPVEYAKRLLVGYTYTSNTLRTLNYTYYRLREGPVNNGYFTDDDDLASAALHFVNRILSVAQGKEITVIVIPTAADMDRISRGHEYQNKTWYTGLRRLSSAHNARFIDLALYTPHDDYGRFYLPCDGHWGPEGHALAAKLYLETN